MIVQRPLVICLTAAFTILAGAVGCGDDEAGETLEAALQGSWTLTRWRCGELDRTREILRDTRVSTTVAGSSFDRITVDPSRGCTLITRSTFTYDDDLRTITISSEPNRCEPAGCAEDACGLSGRPQTYRVAPTDSTFELSNDDPGWPGDRCLGVGGGDRGRVTFSRR